MIRETIKLFLGLILLFNCKELYSQKHTVGLCTINKSKCFKGYTLLYPHEQSSVFLLDLCGEIVHEWKDDPDSRPGNTVYLLEDGSILKTKRSSKVTGNPIWSGGGGGTVERRDWDNNLLWTFTLNDSFNRLHHDIEPLPNGNILMICWTKKSQDEALAKGRNPEFLKNNELWSDKIIEVMPIGTDSFKIVWEWHIWDHLVQDFDSGKTNYGKPENKPGKININYAENASARNWSFLNAISYNVALDQILVSSPSFNEIWIIDHSTSTSEAAGERGGFAKSGGDLIYRWGNPQAYNAGSPADQKLFFQHDAHWMGPKSGDDDYGKILLFNNRAGADYSTVNIFEPVFDQYFWQYQKSNQKYLPANFTWTYKQTDSSAFYSAALSSAQRLKNGNTLICAGQSGYSFEVDPSEEIVWEYITPLKNGKSVKQGDSIAVSLNNTFRVKRYPEDHPAFTGRILSPKGFIELDPDTGFCDLTLNIRPMVKDNGAKSIYPNPLKERMFLGGIKHPNEVQSVKMYSVLGLKVMEVNDQNGFENGIPLPDILDGLYYVTLNDLEVFKVLVSRKQVKF
ncbi:MAG: aryl-sulfate sulfotransferase [Flavobacteriales bacterium]|nr:aryl-sulfate sulfotransferase [Flavobacteriales bacterium]